MNKHLVFYFLLIFFLSLNQAIAQSTYSVGYLEGGSYWIFDKTMDAVKTALKEKTLDKKIIFKQNARFSPGWENKMAWDAKAKILMSRKDLDLIITAGTDATRSILKYNNQRTPILALAVSDPIGSGFVLNEKDSGIENFTVRIVPNRFERMFRIFHEVVQFQKLGLLYPDTKSGKKYTNLDAARKVAKEKNFKLIEYKLDKENPNACMQGLQKLVDQGMDAFFIPSLLCFDWSKNDVSNILTFLRNNKIPTFARNGSSYVKGGALMGFSTIDFSERGNFLADKIERILINKISPRKLPMVDQAVPKISFNLKVAIDIEFDPPFDILSATDELYNEIINPEIKE